MRLVLVLFMTLLSSKLSESVPDDACMKWAIRRIVGGDDVTITDIAKVNVSLEEEGDLTGRHRPGKKGAPGRPGPQGPPGPRGICDCVPDELIELQKENELLKDQVTRIRRSSPETFCLLGMKDGSIPDSSITSSYPRQNTYARLDGSGAWWAEALSSPGKYWVMTDLGQIRHVTGVVTQGRADASQWVTSFKVEHSKDGLIFIDVKNEDRSELIFAGNSNQNTKIINRFPEPVSTRYIRIYPMTYKSYFSLRFDVIDC